MDQVDAINNDGPKLVLNFADKDETELEKIPFLEIVTLNRATSLQPFFKWDNSAVLSWTFQPFFIWDISVFLC